MTRVMTALCVLWIVVFMLVAAPRLDNVTLALIGGVMIGLLVSLPAMAFVVMRAWAIVNTHSARPGGRDLERPDNDAGQGALVLTPHVPRENPVPAPDGMGGE